MRSGTTDRARRTWCALKRCINRDQIGSQPLSERDVPGVVHSQVVAKLPRPSREGLERIPIGAHRADLLERSRRSPRFELPAADEGAQRRRRLSPENRRNLERLHGAQLSASRVTGRAGNDERVNEHRRVDDAQPSFSVAFAISAHEWG